MKERTPPTPGETMMLAFKLLGLRNHSIAELEKKTPHKRVPRGEHSGGPAAAEKKRNA